MLAKYNRARHFLLNTKKLTSQILNTSSSSQNASLQDGIAKSESADQAHDSTILEPSSLAGMSAEPSVFDLHADNEQTPISVTMVGSDVVDRIEIPVKAEERFPRVTRCGGITLHGNQCTHNVKDGSGFCVKHTKHIDIEYSQKTYLDGSSTSNRGVMYTSHKPADMIVFRCRGKTLQGTQCTHNVKDGAAYCLKHGDQDWGPPPKRTELPGLAIPQDRPVQTLVLPAQVPNPTIDPVPIQMPRLLAAPACKCSKCLICLHDGPYPVFSLFSSLCR